MNKHVVQKANNPDKDLIHYSEFIEIMNSLNQVYVGINSQVKLKFYYWALKDLPLKAARDISQHFLISTTKMPTPKDFKDAAKEWVRANKTYAHDDTPVAIECRHCLDLGVNYLTKIESGEFYGLMRCDCKTHVTQDLHAPTWDNALYQTFKRQPCPMNWFKPKDVEEFTLTSGEINNLISEWKKTKRNAEQFWYNLGFR